MRILIIHNLYQHAGGEDVVLYQETKGIRSFAEVETLIFKNKKKSKGLLQVASFPCNLGAWKTIKDKISEFNPDIIHFHNIHYAIGPWSIRKIHRLGIPIIMTVHNYRLICPSATLFHKGKIYLKSVKSNFPWDAVQIGIHDGSRAKTAWFAFTNYLHRKLKTWQLIDRYLVLTNFAKNLIQESSFAVDSTKLVVKPNFSEESQIEPLSPQQPTLKNKHVLFVGRLSEEKGIKTLLNAFKDSEFLLKIAGDGPLKPIVQEAVRSNSNIEYLGALPHDKVELEMRNCRALIFPSEWFEGMPMTIIEAFKNYTPVIASNLGAMASMIQNGQNGFHFKVSDANDLRAQTHLIQNLEQGSYEIMCHQARQSFEQNYRKKENLEQLKAIYEQVLAEK